MAKTSKAGDAKRFDPRFSPEFQPGFVAGVHGEAARAATRAAASRPAPESLITRPARRVQDAPGEPSASDPVRDDAGLTGEDASPEEGTHVNAIDDAEPAAWWRRVNPYLVALGIVGVAIIGVALTWMGWVYEAASSPTVQQFDYLIMQFAMFGAPTLLSVGVLTLVSILVVLAFRYRR